MVDGKKWMGVLAVISLQACFIEAPIQPPACRSKGVAGELGASLFFPDSGFVAEDGGSWELPDGGTGAICMLSFDSRSGGITLPTVVHATNVSHYVYDPSLGGSVAFQTLDPAQPVEFRFTATCNVTRANVVGVTLTPDGGSYDATFTDLP